VDAVKKRKYLARKSKLGLPARYIDWAAEHQEIEPLTTHASNFINLKHMGL
jgi:hypothetical protein